MVKKKLLTIAMFYLLILVERLSSDISTAAFVCSLFCYFYDFDFRIILFQVMTGMLATSCGGHFYCVFASQPELLLFEKMIPKLYINFGIISDDEQIANLVLTNLLAVKYQILSDLSQIIRNGKFLFKKNTYISLI